MVKGVNAVPQFPIGETVDMNLKRTGSIKETNRGFVSISVEDVENESSDAWECRIDPCREIVLMRYPLKRRV